RVAEDAVVFDCGDALTYAVNLICLDQRASWYFAFGSKAGRRRTQSAQATDLADYGFLAASSRAHWRNNCTVGLSVLFLSVTAATGGRMDNSIGNSLSA